MDIASIFKEKDFKKEKKTKTSEQNLVKTHIIKFANTCWANFRSQLNRETLLKQSELEEREEENRWEKQMK